MRRVGSVLAVLGVLAGLVTPAASAAPSPEDRRREIEKELDRLHDEIGEAADEEAELIADLEVSRRLRRDLDAKVAQLDAAIAAAEVDIAKVDAELAAAVTAEDEAEAAVAAAEAELKEATETLRRQAVEAFIRFGNQPTPDQLIEDLGAAADTARLTAYVDAVVERQAAIVARQRQLQEDTTVLRARAAEAKAAVAAHQQEVRARKAALESARADQAAARAEVAAEAATEQRLLAQVQAKRSDYQKRIKQLERESNDITALLRRRQSNQGITPSGKGVLASPLANPVITSTFGWRTHPIYGDRRLHAGIDFRAATGTAVYAAGAGTVVFAGWKSGYGNTVVIDHGGSLATLYAHNSQLTVSVGESVARKERIALSGSTGNSTGPHVHFEVRSEGAPVDPLKYL